MTSHGSRNLGLVVLIVGMVVAGHFLPGLDNSRVEDGIRNSMHIIVFAALALVLFEACKNLGAIKAAAIALAIVVVVGGLSELLQSASSRQPDMRDVARDGGGALLALAARLMWHFSAYKTAGASARNLLRSLTGILGLAVFMPVLFWVSIVGLGRLSEPVVVGFDRWWNHYTYRLINAESIGESNHDGAAEIQLLKWRRSGLVVSPLLSDWRDYEFLSISTGMLRGPDTNVTIRINDGDRKNDWSDLFMRSIVVTSESTVIRIPLRELRAADEQTPMNLADIREIVIFARDRRDDSALIIQDIRLE